MVMPGDNVKMVVTLINPVAMDEGLRFAIREGGRTVGAGVVAKIIEYSLILPSEKGPSGAPFFVRWLNIDTLWGHPYNCASF
ncbi:hypothetical protein G6F66_014861 [Rhizopus arrhizus]|nr:hypothetical protein G6F66_014861 [Rhizopus arrhizus]